MGFDGLIVTDALEMKGISKYYNHGQKSLQSPLAGNDLMELLSTAKGSVSAIATAIKRGTISRAEVYRRVKKVLRAKCDLGLMNVQTIDPVNITGRPERRRAVFAEKDLRRSHYAASQRQSPSPAAGYDRQQKLAVVAVGVGWREQHFH